MSLKNIMANSNCIVSVSFREPYLTHSKKQEEVVRGFSVDCDLMYFRDELPTAKGIVRENIVAEFQKSLYGFKPHAIQKAIDAGYKKVIWFDPSVLPAVSPQILFDSLDEHPMIVRAGEHPLKKMCSVVAQRWMDISDKEMESLKHIGGTIYGFNFSNAKSAQVFKLWIKLEEIGLFGTQDDFMAGHWADESCMALALHKCWVPQYWEEKFTYLNQKEL